MSAERVTWAEVREAWRTRHARRQAMRDEYNAITVVEVATAVIIQESTRLLRKYGETREES